MVVNRACSSVCYVDSDFRVYERNSPMSELPFFDVDSGRRQRVRRVRWTLLCAIVAIMLAAFVFSRLPGKQTYTIKISAGSDLGHRHDLAEVLANVARERRLSFEIVPTLGSVDTLDLLSRGDIDLAFVQGGLSQRDQVRQIATLIPEPLHLVVRESAAIEKLADLKGKTVNLSTPGSGTRLLALAVLEFAGVAPEDYDDKRNSYAELQVLPETELPDAVFVVSSLPSAMVEWLTNERDYRLVELPFGRALAVRNLSIGEFEIPAFTYGVEPARPARDTLTLATRLELLVNANVDDDIVKRVAEVLFSNEYAREANLPPLDAEKATSRLAYELHPGAVTFLRRDNPLITSELVEYLENARSFLVSAAVALFLLYRWYARRMATGFEKHIDRVTHVELDVLQSARSGGLTVEKLLDEEIRLSKLKAAALEQFASGSLKGDEHLSSFLTHVADVRRLLQGLYAHTKHEV